jgi:8-oxo-dGTP pyrophosphatase MutT (NUDIX family)
MNNEPEASTDRTLIHEIPPHLKHDWVVTIDGRKSAPIQITASHARLGTLAWGLRPEGTVGWIWQEIGGVGTVPYSVHQGRLLIGLIQQERKTIPGGTAWNIPRGFLEPGLTHFEGARKETTEELGAKQLMSVLKELPGEPVNSNSTFFDTRNPCGGFRYFSLSVADTFLDYSQEYPVFREGYFAPVSDPAERILNCRFIPWREAAYVSDNFTIAGVARLIASDGSLLPHLR